MPLLCQIRGLSLLRAWGRSLRARVRWLQGLYIGTRWIFKRAGRVFGSQCRLLCVCCRSFLCCLGRCSCRHSLWHTGFTSHGSWFIAPATCKERSRRQYRQTHFHTPTYEADRSSLGVVPPNRLSVFHSIVSRAGSAPPQVSVKAASGDSAAKVAY
jgi:hypothetical protein